MTNKCRGSGDEHSRKVEGLFDRIALRYDLINDVQSFGLHRLWKRRVLKLASVQPGDRALDVCCGTGDLALALARSGAEVIGLDFSERMLQIAQARGAREIGFKAEKPNPRFLRGAAEELPFPNNTFDMVTIGYGLRNLANWETGLREISRVAKPSARLVVLEFGKPDNPLWRRLYFGYLKVFVPLLGGAFCGDPSAYAYILESLKQYPAQRGVAANMRELGLINVNIINLLGGAMSINYGEKDGSVGAME